MVWSLLEMPFFIMAACVTRCVKPGSSTQCLTTWIDSQRYTSRKQGCSPKRKRQEYTPYLFTIVKLTVSLKFKDTGINVHLSFLVRCFGDCSYQYSILVVCFVPDTRPAWIRQAGFQIYQCGLSLIWHHLYITKQNIPDKAQINRGHEAATWGTGNVQRKSIKTISTGWTPFI